MGQKLRIRFRASGAGSRPGVGAMASEARLESDRGPLIAIGSCEAHNSYVHGGEKEWLARRTLPGKALMPDEDDG